MNANRWHKRSATTFPVQAHVNTYQIEGGNTRVQVSLVTTGNDEQQWMDINMTNTEARALAELLVRRAGQVVAPPDMVRAAQLMNNGATVVEAARQVVAEEKCGCKPEPECVICDNEGPHHHGRPHVYAGQE